MDTVDHGAGASASARRHDPDALEAWRGLVFQMGDCTRRPGVRHALSLLAFDDAASDVAPDMTRWEWLEPYLRERLAVSADKRIVLAVMGGRNDALLHAHDQAGLDNIHTVLMRQGASELRRMQEVLVEVCTDRAEPNVPHVPIRFAAADVSRDTLTSHLKGLLHASGGESARCVCSLPRPVLAP